MATQDQQDMVGIIIKAPLMKAVTRINLRGDASSTTSKTLKR